MALIWGEDKKPPSYGPIIYNISFALTCLLFQVLGISPNDVMAFAGTSSGFVMIYLHPLAIHLKALRTKEIREKQTDSEKPLAKESEEIAEFLEKQKISSYAWEYFIHGLIMAVGVFILIINVVDLVKQYTQ